MNQILKNSIYTLGTQEQLDFLAVTGGMTESERRVLQMLHEDCTDLTIQESLGIPRKQYPSVEQMVRLKLALAVFECINKAMA